MWPLLHHHAATLALALQMVAKDVACREAPPTKKPSTSSLPARSPEFLSFTDPPAGQAAELISLSCKPPLLQGHSAVLLTIDDPRRASHLLADLL